MDQRADAAGVEVAHDHLHLVAARRQRELARDRVPGLLQPPPGLRQQRQLELLVVAVVLAGLAVLRLDQEGERVVRPALRLLEVEALHVDLDPELDAELVEADLVEDPGRGAQGHVGDLERRVEGVPDRRVALLLAGDRLPLERREVAAAGAHLEPLRKLGAQLHLDLAELAVLAQVARVVAEQVVDARLRGDAVDAAREVVRVLDHEAAGVEREGLRALGVAAEVGQDRDHVLRLGGPAEGGGEGVRQRLQAAGVDEVDGHVVAPRGEHDVLLLLELEVVDEALRDEDHRLAALDPRQRVDRARHHPERDPVARPGELVDLARPHAHDLRDHPGRRRLGVGRAHAAHVLLLPGGPVVVETTLDLPGHRLVLVHLDAHRLEVGDAVGRGVRDEAAVEPLQDVDERLPPLRHAGRPPGAAAGGDQRHHVALADTALQERRHHAARALGLLRREVDVVEHDGEGPAALLVGLEVGRDPGTRRRRDAPDGNGGHGHGLEARQRLRDAVLVDREVLTRQPARGLALLVHHHGVDGDELDLRLERRLDARRLRCRRRRGGLLGRGLLRVGGDGGRERETGDGHSPAQTRAKFHEVHQVLRLSPRPGRDQGAEGGADDASGGPATRNEQRSQARCWPLRSSARTS